MMAVLDPKTKESIENAIAVMDDLAGRKSLIEASGLKTGRILDVGMGHCGCMAFSLARSGFQVIGIDYLTDAVYDSKQDAQKEHHFSGTFEALVANGERLPFGTCQFDAVVAYHALHHMDNVKQVIAEMFRVCKPAGFVLIADFHENGRKAYKHKPDSGKLLKTIEHCLTKYTPSIRKVKTEYNLMFICKK